MHHCVLLLPATSRVISQSSLPTMSAAAWHMHRSAQQVTMTSVPWQTQRLVRWASNAASAIVSETNDIGYRYLEPVELCVVWHDSHATWHHVYERKCDLNQWKSFGFDWRSCNMSTCNWKDLRSEPWHSAVALSDGHENDNMYIKDHWGLNPWSLVRLACRESHETWQCV